MAAPIGENNEAFTWFIRLAIVTLVVAIMRFAQDVLIPIAFAALLAFLLSPLVVRLGRWGLPKPAAIIVTVSFAFAVLGGIGWVVSVQAIGVVRQLPDHEATLRQKIAGLKQPHSPAFLSRIADMFGNLQRDLRAKPERAEPPPRPDDEPKPVPVQVKAAEVSALQLARDVAMPILRPLGVAGMVVVFVVFMLFQREDLRDRVIKFVSAGQLNVATQALDDAATRVSRYLGMQLVVNATYGIPVGIGLYFIGIPNALLWGILATLLRFIPFLGPWIAASFPILLAVVVDPGWTKVMYVLGLFIVMELISNNVIEVVLYGASTGISNLALLVAAVFWTWLWGPAGLVLSTPLTVLLLVLGKYVPGLNFLRMLLGSDPVLEPPAQLYQRMLSMESDDMLDVAQKHLETKPLEAFYDEVFIPALLLAEEDRHRGALTEMRQRFIFEASRELIDELAREDEAADRELAPDSDPNTAPPAAAAAPQPLPAPPAILVVPARDEADEVVGLMLSHLLRRRGAACAVQPAGSGLRETLEVIERQRVKLVIISGLPPSTVSAARQVYRRLRAGFATLPIAVAIWRHRTSAVELQARLHTSRNDPLLGSLAEAVAAVEAAGIGLEPPRPRETDDASAAEPPAASPAPAS
ncbi:AI-2E family transporter [Opitutus sp. ER46]|uniref:AI-2E family transporter n=1 Tax=Opitutus sp. ER46 TaxID=2161864 RepID=UPI000D31C583|nr:AI-2E family transporter [Opitutus sp. ER46]PTX94211.1 AI-2E family transporter [Opitutus sp. ER46]